ncbi:MAG: hypothetical protein LBQ87_07080 [Candidatus Fibromonas sp.]|jgi:hypothetical protein|nr:hypothetical protein [Candidatus Fibromonas sp.]
MNTLVIKIIIILCLVFSFGIFAWSGYCDDCEEEKEDVFVQKNKAGMVRTVKTVDFDSIREVTETIIDSKGKLIFSGYRKYKEGLKYKERPLLGSSYYLVQVINDGVVWNIIQGETPCDFTVIGPSGDSVSFHLNPKGKPEALTRNEFNFLLSMASTEYKYVKDTSYGYSDIASFKQHGCWKYHLPWPEEE